MARGDLGIGGKIPGGTFDAPSAGGGDGQAAPGSIGVGLVTSPHVRDELTSARFASPAVQNNLLNVRPRAVQYVTVDRPMLLVPLTVQREPVWYAPISQPQVEFTAGAVDVGGEASRSIAHGIVFLTHPGRWWIYSNEATDVLPYLLQDGTNPISTSIALAADGDVGSIVSSATEAGVGVATYAQVALANVHRKALIIQNRAGYSIRVCVTDKDTIAPAAVSLGFFLPNNGSISWFGATLTKKTVWARADDGLASGGFVVGQEFF